MKHFYRTVAALLSLLAAAYASADIPAGYYSSLDGKKEGELKTAIHTIVHNFTRVTYSNLPHYFQQTDVYPDSHRWWDMYSDIPLYAPSFSGLNREHSFPKSWWGGSTSVGAYVDLNHLYPSEREANTAKSNYPLGIVNRSSNVKFDNGICAVGYPVNGQGGGASFVFEPDDQYKGDFARTYFYMATAYQDLTWKYTYMVSQNLYPTLNGWSVELLMKWHRDDPVSQKEIDRNEAVFAIQNNRNPFIDMPELAEYLWGTKKGESFTPGSVVVPPTGDPELLAPTKDMELQFGQVALGSSLGSKLYVHGKNLTGSIDVTLWSGDSNMFSVPQDGIPASLVCSDDGYWLTVTYEPSALGQHSTKLLLSGAFGSRSVVLRGECLPVPTLSAVNALPATDVTSDSYTANWEAPLGDVVDYYLVTRTRYVGGDAFTETLPAEDTSLEITGFGSSDQESYTVQSVRLGHMSPMSNVVFVNHSGIEDILDDEPLIVRSFPGFIRFICSSPQTGCRIYDVAGRLVKEIGTVSQDMDVEISAGVYLIVTDSHRSPLKVSVR